MREMYRDLVSFTLEGWTLERTRRVAEDVLLLAALILTSSWVVHP